MEAPTRKRGRPKGSKNKAGIAGAKLPGLFHDPSLASNTEENEWPLTAMPMRSQAHSLGLPSIFVKLGKPTPTQVFSTYWWFACERQRIFFEKIRRPQGPIWTDDPTLRRHKFTNAYRASDRVSQYLIDHVINVGDPELRTSEEVFFRTILFKIFNKIDTWELLERVIGTIRWSEYRFQLYDDALSEALKSGCRIYSAAYIMACPNFGRERKHSNHLKLLEAMMNSRIPDVLHQQKDKLEFAFNQIRTFPGIGDFLAYQYVVDLNYGPLLDASENDFVVPGPGALDGIRKCFSDIGDYSPADVIKYACDLQGKSFAALDLDFLDLWGRELHLIDCQNLFCEVDKYARVHHPEAKGRSDRTRIKQIYRPTLGAIYYQYPRRWNLDGKIAEDPAYEHARSV